MNPENEGINGKSDKETQTKQSAGKSDKLDAKPRQNLPLPRDLSNCVKGPITTFEFCKVFQPTNEPCGLTIVHKQITEEEIEPENSEINRKKYRYCKEILKPYLKNYPPNCPDLTEDFIKNSIKAADEETPDQQPCFTFEGFKISGLDPSDLLRDNSEGSKTSEKKLGSPEDTKVSEDFKDTEYPKNPKNNDSKGNKDSKDNEQLKNTEDNTSAKTDSQVSKRSTDSKKSAGDKTSHIICKPFEDLSVDKVKSLNQILISSSTDSAESEKPTEKPKHKRKVCKTKRKSSKSSSISTKSNSKSVTTIASDIQTAQDKLTPVENNNISKEANVKDNLISTLSDSSSTSKSKFSDKSDLPSQIESNLISKPDSDPKSYPSSKIKSMPNYDINMICKLVKKPSKKSDKVEYKPSEKSDPTQKTEIKLTEKSDDLQPTDKYFFSNEQDTKPNDKSKKTESKLNDESDSIQKTDTKSTDKLESETTHTSSLSCNISCNLSCALETKPSKKLDKLESKPSEKSDSTQKTDTKLTDKSDKCKIIDKPNLTGKLETKLSNKSDKMESKTTEKRNSTQKTDTILTNKSDESKIIDKENITRKLETKSSKKCDRIESKTNEKSNSTQKTDTKLTDKSDKLHVEKSNLTVKLEKKPSKETDKIESTPIEKSNINHKKDIKCDESNLTNNSDLSGKLEIKPSKISDHSNKKECTPSKKSNSALHTESKSTDKSSSESKPSDKANILSKLDSKPCYKSDSSSKNELKLRETGEPKFCDKEKSKVLSKENTNLKSESTCKTDANPIYVSTCNKSDSTSKPADSKPKSKSNSTNKADSDLAIEYHVNQSDSMNKIDSKLTNKLTINKSSSKIDSKNSNKSTPTGEIESKLSQKSNISRQTDSDIGTSQCELSIFRIITTRVCALNDSEGSPCSSKLTIENTNDKNSDNHALLDAKYKEKMDSNKAALSDNNNKKHLHSEKPVQSDSCSKKKSDFSSKITSETQFCNITKGNSTTESDLNVIKNVSKDSIECESKLSKCMKELKESREKGRICPPFEDLSSQKTKSVNPLREDSKTSDSPPESSCTPSKKSSKSKSSKSDDKGELMKFRAPFEALDTSKTKMCNPTSENNDGGKFCPPFSELSREKVKSFSAVPKQNQSGEKIQPGKNECVPVTRRKIETFVCPENQTVYTVITSMLCPSCDNHSTEKSSVKSSSSKESKKSDDNVPPTQKNSTISLNKVDQSTRENEIPVCPLKPVESPTKPENKLKPPPGSEIPKKRETNKCYASTKENTELEEKGPKPADKFEQLKQNMLEAHCKTMATIKVAAKDVLCTVAKKTKEMCEDPENTDNVRKSAEDLFNEIKNKTSEMCPERHPATVYGQIFEKTKNLCKTTKDTVSGYFSHDEKCEPKPKTKTVSNSLPGHMKGFNLFNKFRKDDDEETEEDEGDESPDTLASALDTCTKDLSERLSRLTFNAGETCSIYDNPTPKGSTPRKMTLSDMGVDMPESASAGMFSSIKEKILSMFREKEDDKELLSIPSDHTLSIERDSKEDSDIDEADP